MAKEILKLSPYCWPERVSSSHLTDDMNVAFREAGFHTTVYAPTPCRGIDAETRKKYKSIKRETIAEGSIEIHRFAMFREGRNPIGRAIRYVLVNLIQLRKGAKAEGIDIVYGASTPPTQGLLLGKVKKKLSKRYGRNVPFVFNLQDVFPDSLVTAGLTKKGSLIWKIGRKIEDKTYKNADKIIVISNDIKRNIMEKGVPEDKIVVIPNWIDTDAVQPVSREKNSLFDELGLDRNGFYVTYAGNLGLAQGVDTILDAADQLKDHPEIQFVIFGGGNKQEEYKQRIAAMPNVQLFSLQPAERVPEVYSLGNLSVVACRKGAGSGAIPSKTVSIMATATPVLLSFDEGSELWRLIGENDCGYLAPAEDADALARQILAAQQDTEACRRKGENARRLVETRFSKETGTYEYVKVFQGACAGMGN
jgi:glycosyltransferase involved in cell wall biosynthesis